jgi:NitT/TauT family transport system substrate-binding protein
MTAVRPSKQFLLLPCLLVLLVVPTSARSAVSAEHGGAPTSISIAVLPIEPAAIAFYAKDRGYFRRQGLDVTLKILADPLQLGSAVMSGQVEFSFTSIGVLALLKTRGLPVKLVAAAAINRPKAPTSALVAAPGKRITRARDLVGKVVAIDGPNTPAHIGLLKWLKLRGVSADKVRLNYIPFALMPGPLRRGTVDAAVLPEPLVTVVTRRGAKRIAPIINAVCPQDCLLTGVMARRDTDPGLAARLRNALQAAAVWANQKRNDRASGAILARYTGVDEALIGRVTRTAFASRLRLAPAQPWIDAYAEFGVIPRSFPAAELVK